MDNISKNLIRKNLPNEIHKEIIDKDGTKLIFNITDINKIKTDIYDFLITTKYDESKEKYQKEMKIYNIKRCLLIAFTITVIILSCCALKSILKNGTSWPLWVLDLIFYIIDMIILCNLNNPTKYGNNAELEYQKYYDANMDKDDIDKIYNLDHLFNILNKIENLKNIQPIKIKVDTDKIEILSIDENKYPKTLLICNQLFVKPIFYFEFKDIENIELTNRLSTCIVNLPLKYSNEYKELVK